MRFFKCFLACAFALLSILGLGVNSNEGGGAKPSTAPLVVKPSVIQSEAKLAEIKAYLKSKGVEPLSLRFNPGKQEWIASLDLNQVAIERDEATGVVQFKYKEQIIEGVESLRLTFSQKTVKELKSRGVALSARERQGVSDVYKIQLQKASDKIVLFILKDPPETDDEIKKISLLEVRAQQKPVRLCGLIDYKVTESGMVLLDYKDGTLNDFNATELKQKKLTPELSFNLGLQFLESLLCLKKLGFAYIDIKPFNLYYTMHKKKVQLFLGDLGSIYDLKRMDHEYVKEQIKRLAVTPGLSVTSKETLVSTTDYLLRTGLAYILIKLTFDSYPINFLSRRNNRRVMLMMDRLIQVEGSNFEKKFDPSIRLVKEPLLINARKSGVSPGLMAFLEGLIFNKSGTLEEAHTELKRMHETLKGP